MEDKAIVPETSTITELDSFFNEIAERFPKGIPATGSLVVPKDKDSLVEWDLYLDKKEPENSPKYFVLRMRQRNGDLSQTLKFYPTAIQPGKLDIRLASIGGRSFEFEKILDKQEFGEIADQIMRNSRWGKEPDFNPFGYLKIGEISPSALNLDDVNIPSRINQELQQRRFFSVDNGRIIIEVGGDEFKKERQSITLIDFDDSLFSATDWHKAEFRKVAESWKLRKRGINIASDEVRRIYELSKIHLPGLAEKERRYTPRLNLALLTKYIKELEEGKTTEQAEESMLALRDRLIDEIREKGEGIIRAYELDKALLEIFIENDPAEFVFEDTASDLLDKPDDLIKGSAEDDLKVIITRGKIDGLLGQIHKLHAAGLASRADIVIYTNDLKAETFELLGQLLPWVKGKQVRVYDDNPNEIVEWWQMATRKGLLDRLELVQIRHPKAKRRLSKADIEPAARIGKLEQVKQIPEETTGETVYDHYIGSAFHPSRIY